MASLRARSSVSIRAVALTSAPYVDLTLQAMADFGASVRRSGDSFAGAPRHLEGGRFEIEADYSSACYFGAAAAVTGGRVALAGLRSDSRQGDARFFSVLERMGARSRWIDGRLEVAGSNRLEAVSESFADMPDQVPTLAAVAPFASGTTRVRDVGHLRHKESDRLGVVARELARAGADGVVETATGISVPGLWIRAEPPSQPVSIDTADDHRIAMSFAVLGLRRPGLAVADPDVVAKSYPDFWDDFRAVCEA
jgi:3-phosphoshikimate 1-carboxyvinyltransferase